MKNLNYLFISFLFLCNYSLAQTTVTLKPGPANGNDAFVWDYNPNTNYGTAEGLDVTTWTAGGTYISRAFLRFDLSSIPQNSTIVSAQLSLFYNNTNPSYSGVHSGANASFLQRVTSSWQGSSVTWNNQPTTTTSNQVALAQTTSGTQDFTNIDVTSLVNDMFYGTSNYGFMLRLQNEIIYKDLIFASSNHANAALRPKLVITYAPCIAPAAQISPSSPFSFCAGTSAFFSVTATPLASYQWQKNNVNIAGATSSTYSTSVGGNYKCIVTSICGLTATSSSVKATKLAVASVSISAAGPTTFCGGGNVTLNGTNPGAGYTFQWYKNYITVPGATGLSYVASSPGTYRLMISNTSTGCSRLSGGITVKVNNCKTGDALLSNDDIVSENKLLMYPNPTHNSFTFELSDSPDFTDKAQVVLLNALGQQVYKSMSEIENGQLVHLIEAHNNFQPGIYFLQVSAGNSFYQGRVIVQ